MVMVLVTTCIVLLLYRYCDRNYISKLKLSQDETSITANWDGVVEKNYDIQILKDGKLLIQEEDWSKDSYKLEDIDYHCTYIFKVSGLKENGEMSRSAEEQIYTRAPQNIETSIEEARGFKSDVIALEASADGSLEYCIKDEEKAELDSEDNIVMLSVGRTQLTITAAETDESLAGEKTIEIICYPKKLKQAELTIKEKDNATAVFTWEKVSFADKYILLKYVEAEKEYRAFKSFSADEMSENDKFTYTSGRDVGKYKIQAKATVGDSVLKSESTEVEIKSNLDKAETYSSLKIVQTYDKSNLEYVGRATGAGSATTAQSMSITDDAYIVTFINKGNSVGCLTAVDKSGNLIMKETTGDIGHGNGSTYNPYTDNLYIMKAYSKRKSREIAVFDGTTLDKKDSKWINVAPSAIAYDTSNNEYYFTASSRIYIMDSEMNRIKTYHRLRYSKSQDVAGYNGVIMSCIWPGGKNSYIDMYRESDGAYLGSILVPLGEIESCGIDDGKLVILMAHGHLYRSKENIAIPQ